MWRVVKWTIKLLAEIVVMMVKVVLGVIAGVFLMIAFLAHFVGGPR